MFVTTNNAVLMEVWLYSLCLSLTDKVTTIDFTMWHDGSINVKISWDLDTLLPHWIVNALCQINLSSGGNFGCVGASQGYCPVSTCFAEESGGCPCFFFGCYSKFHRGAIDVGNKRQNDCRAESVKNDQELESGLSALSAELLFGAGGSDANQTQHRLSEVPSYNQSLSMNSMQTCHSVTFYFITKDSKRCCDTTTNSAFPVLIIFGKIYFLPITEKEFFKKKNVTEWQFSQISWDFPLFTWIHC